MKFPRILSVSLCMWVGGYSSVHAKTAAFWDELIEHKSKQQAYALEGANRPEPRKINKEPRRSAIVEQVTRVEMGEVCRSHVKNVPESCVIKSKETRQGIINQISFLQNSKATFSKVSYTNVSDTQMLQTAQHALRWIDGDLSGSFADHFELHALDSASKVKYTGYFTPHLSASFTPDREHRYPIYGKPTSNYLPNRVQISKGALAGRNLEIAWTNDPVGLYLAQIQGSAVLAMKDGRFMELHYAGNSGDKFISVPQHMFREGHIAAPSNKEMKHWLNKNPHRIDEMLNANPRYVYFKLSRAERATASGLVPIAGHTVAVDTSHIPFGSILLAEIPMRDKNGKATHKEWRLLFPQDRGGHVKGKKHLDIYTGIGTDAKHMTKRVTGVGRAYLLMGKKDNGFRTASRNY